MRLAALKDLIVVATLFAGVTFAGVSVVRAFDGAPVNDNASSVNCAEASSVVVLTADEPAVEPPLECV